MTRLVAASVSSAVGGALVGAVVTAILVGPIGHVSEASRGPDPGVREVLARLNSLEDRLSRRDVVPDSDTRIGQLIARLDSLDVRLAALRNPIKSELCFKTELSYAGKGTAGAAAEGKGEARGGAEVHGSGGFVGFVKKVKSWWQSRVKAERKIESSWCREGFQFSEATASEDAPAALLAAAVASEAMHDGVVAVNARRGTRPPPFHVQVDEKLVAVGELFGLTDDPRPILDLMLQVGDDDFGLFGALSPKAAALRGLLASLPGPQRLRDRFGNAGQIVEELRDFRDQGLCGNPDLPDGFEALLERFCDFRESNAFKRMLERIDTVTGGINTITSNIDTKVQNVINRLPDGGSGIFK